MKRLAAIAMLVALLVPAQAGAEDTEAEARVAFQRGRAHYKAGEFAQAVVELSKAYSLKPRPALLRYMGDCYFKMNNAPKAIELYKKYLTEAPQAADREKVESKVRQLELIIGASEEEETETMAPPPEPVPAPAPAPAPAPTADPVPEGKSSIDMAPTGEDREVPEALRHKRQAEQAKKPVDTSEPTSTLTVMKWVAAAVGVAGLAMGITFNRLAAGKASDLEDAVKIECPAGNPSCGGNPEMNKPQVQFSETHFNLQQDYKRNQGIALAGFIIGGVAAGTSVLLFFLDRPEKERRTAESSRNLSLAPVVGRGVYGFAGELSF